MSGRLCFLARPRGGGGGGGGRTDKLCVVAVSRSSPRPNPTLWLSILPRRQKSPFGNNNRKAPLHFLCLKLFAPHLREWAKRYLKVFFVEHFILHCLRSGCGNFFYSEAPQFRAHAPSFSRRRGEEEEKAKIQCSFPRRKEEEERAFPISREKQKGGGRK